MSFKCSNGSTLNVAMLQTETDETSKIHFWWEFHLITLMLFLTYKSFFFPIKYKMKCQGEWQPQSAVTFTVAMENLLRIVPHIDFIHCTDQQKPSCFESGFSVSLLHGLLHYRHYRQLSIDHFCPHNWVSLCGKELQWMWMVT